MSLMRWRLIMNQKGQSAVEFTFVFLFLIAILALLVGLTEITWHWVIMQYAASEASRFGSLGIIDPGSPSREATIRTRVTQITDNFGIDNITVDFFDENNNPTAGGGSQYFRMRLSKPLQLQAIIGNFLAMVGMLPGSIPIYQMTVWTVIRNEPF